MEKKKKKQRSKIINTFQGNKSPCDSDCLFNNAQQKKAKRKYCLKTAQKKVADNTLICPNRSESTARESCDINC